MRDRHVLISGGSGALGIHVTKRFVELGAKVTVPVFDEREVNILAQHLGPAAREVLLVRADLTKEPEVEKLLAELPGLDAVTHLVGGFSMGETVNVSLEEYRAQFDLNVMTTFVVLKHSLRRMQRSGYGRIVTVASRAALQPSAQMAIYSAAKAAVLAMTRAVAEETKGTNITANCVLPSVIDTPANRQAMGSEHAHAWVSPHRLAHQIAFLTSEEAGDQRGTAIQVYANA